MSTSDDLSRLADLHARGQLSDEEFARAKERVLNGASASTAGGPQFPNSLNGLRRSVGDRWIGGVCGGFARITNIDSWIWRLLFVIFALCAGGGVLAYILLWIFMPEE